MTWSKSEIVICDLKCLGKFIQINGIGDGAYPIYRLYKFSSDWVL